jgi:hypothetical protein
MMLNISKEMSVSLAQKSEKLLSNHQNQSYEAQNWNVR